MEVKVEFLPDCPLVLSQRKHKSVELFLNKKLRNLYRGSPKNRISIVGD